MAELKFINYIVGVWLIVHSCQLFSQKNDLPNIIIIQFDDLAYGDLGYQGAHDICTKNIDALASESLIFENAFSNSPVCSPARASLMTGMHPNNIGILGVLRSQHDSLEIFNRVKNIAQYLKEINYNTALIGKWHLGISPVCQPQNLGFDYFFGCLSGMVDYYTHIGRGGMDGQHNLFENGIEVFDKGYFTSLITQKSVEFIKNQDNNPYLLIVNYTAPHTPLQSNHRYLDSISTNREIYKRMVELVDSGVKNIVDELKRRTNWENTILIITNDHGWSTRNEFHKKTASNKGLSLGKYYLKDGGLRVPLIIKLPNYQHDTIAYNVTHADILPTILNLTNHPSKSINLYGKDLINIINNDNRIDRYLYWSFKDRFTNEQEAIRLNHWKYIIDGNTEYLFNTQTDKGEKKNIIGKYPKIGKSLRDSVQIFFNQVEYSEWKS